MTPELIDFQKDTYERWKKESLVAAVLMTFLLHASFNLVGALGMIFLHR